ncbi:hypothetical protein HETIRDRAFT_118000 [Heterobasidion irregulare TC 32-1]|uniref:Uncharacterized protein n=1 Tax=Heterobasidion irregulare (strain TC 32-1) TaxID=747525 RepID=W4K6M5_HETIT|nr:uncharacterized protein HETIRDRAFT_118000 [Heterobasidion irregulare TC 32-1]ETW81482.1 hypothetical protein HETIRDRAFT_118000 [Heterobasidion irregulare TC 32-1]
MYIIGQEFPEMGHVDGRSMAYGVSFPVGIVNHPLFDMSVVPKVLYHIVHLCLKKINYFTIGFIVVYKVLGSEVGALANVHDRAVSEKVSLLVTLLAESGLSIVWQGWWYRLRDGWEPVPRERVCIRVREDIVDISHGKDVKGFWHQEEEWGQESSAIEKLGEQGGSHIFVEERWLVPFPLILRE